MIKRNVRFCIAAVISLSLATLVTLTTLLALTGCASAGSIKEASPRFVSAEILASGDGSEAGQRVELRLQFTSALALDAPDAALADFTITLNGKELDKEAINTTVTIDLSSANTLLLALTPAAGTGGPSSAHYFALYDGAFRVAARDSKGALPHVLAASDNTACAELPTAIDAQVPSGLRILNQGDIKGSAAENTKASCVFRVMELPRVRVMAFIELSPGGEQIRLHNHEFYNYSNANRDEFASMLAEEIKTLLGDEYLVVPSADSVTIAHNKLVDGEVLLPRVIEGVAGSA